MSKPFLLIPCWILVLAMGPIDAFAERLDYFQLQMKDVEEMEKDIRPQIEKAKSYIKDRDRENAINSLEVSMLHIFSRPNGDNILSSLFSQIRPRLKDTKAYESSLSGMVLSAMKKLEDESLKPSSRATQIVILDNFMSELKPEVSSNTKIKDIFVRIRDAKIKVPSSVSNDFLLKGLGNQRRSPSDIAAEIIGK